ncbi:MAG: hypothetical protein J6Y37_12440 [Paludibacteraceae bacterium]|nr:hypothetical protein [Paludibacteraceae bacterium]
MKINGNLNNRTDLGVPASSLFPWAHGHGYMYVATTWLGNPTGKPRSGERFVAVDANPREKAKIHGRMEIRGHLNNRTESGFCVFVNVVSDSVG